MPGRFAYSVTRKIPAVFSGNFSFQYTPFQYTTNQYRYIYNACTQQHLMLLVCNHTNFMQNGEPHGQGTEEAR